MVAAFVAVAALCSMTQAGVIPTSGGVALVTGGGTASVTGPFTTVPNNHPSDLPNNFAAIAKAFTSVTVPLDIVFNVTSSDGITEYLFAEGVFNNTGIDWTDYHIELGFGTGENFQLAPVAGLLSFDPTPAPSSVDFPSTTLGTQTLDFFDGPGIPAGSELSLSFTINVPDGIEQFTLRQQPSIVPEPSSVALMGAGALGLLLVGRRRRNG